MNDPFRQWAVPGFVGLCLLLGGASAAGYLVNAMLQLLAIGLLLVVWSRFPGQRKSRSEKYLLVLVAAMLGVIVLQFIPIPLDLWSSLPGRSEISETLQAVGIELESGFVSIMPHESLKSAIWLLPPLAVLVAMMRMRGLVSEFQLALVIIVVTCAGVIFGALQLVGGDQSPFYFYSFTNRGQAVGLFSNANHMASLLLISIPFQAVLLRQALTLAKESRLPALIAISAAFAITLAGIAANGSLAGYGLLLPVLFASALIVWEKERKLRLLALLLIPAVLGGIALVLLNDDAQVLLNRGSSMRDGDREVIFATSFEAIRQYWPLGSGIGTFSEVYPLFENPQEVTNHFANHAHNDYLEIVLETGIAGLVLLVAFLGWWTVAALNIWRQSTSSYYARAASIASAAVLVHSIVDYPLRTAAIATVFAVCCVQMAGSAIRPGVSPAGARSA